MLPAEPRLPGARERVERSQYFVVHAPRQTGKTTSLMALARDLTAAGKHVALVASCEVAKTTEDDVGAAGRAILDRVAAAARLARLAPERPPSRSPPRTWSRPRSGVIVRALTFGIQAGITAEPRAFLLPDGRLDFRKILQEFAAWWKLNGEFLAKSEVYHEVAPQLIFMAYLQRVVNGGGFVDREYGIGTGRTDILVRKPCTGPDGKPALQMEAMELKVRTGKTGGPLPEALNQLDGYLSRCGLDDGYLLIFDRRPAAVRQEIQPRFTQEITTSGRAVTVLRA